MSREELEYRITTLMNKLYDAWLDDREDEEKMHMIEVDIVSAEKDLRDLDELEKTNATSAG